MLWLCVDGTCQSFFKPCSVEMWHRNSMNIRSIRTISNPSSSPLSTEMCWPSQATLTSTGQSQLSFEALWTKAAALQHHGAEVVIFLPKHDARWCPDKTVAYGKVMVWFSWKSNLNGRVNHDKCIDGIWWPSLWAYGYTTLYNQTMALRELWWRSGLQQWKVLVEKLEAQMFSRLIISHHELLPRTNMNETPSYKTGWLAMYQLLKCEVPCKCRTMQKHARIWSKSRASSQIGDMLSCSFGAFSTWLYNTTAFLMVSSTPSVCQVVLAMRS